MTEYVLRYKDAEVTSGTLWDCWREMIRKFGWMTVSDLDLIGVEISPRN